MTTLVVESSSVQIPGWASADLPAFRRWVHLAECSEKTRVCYLDGEVWVDMSKELFFTHNQVKLEFTLVLGGLVKAQRLGRFVPDGMLLSNDEANLASQPDGAFVSSKSMQAGRVRLLEGSDEGYVEIEGTPDMVLEVISTSSVTKDTVTLRELYWQAGIPEYWLVDARGERLVFEILRYSARGYVVTKRVAGWQKSAVFGMSFRLARHPGEDGNPLFELAVR